MFFQTGMRDTDSVLNIEKSILGPIRSTLARWMGDEAIMNSKKSYYPEVHLF